MSPTAEKHLTFTNLSAYKNLSWTMSDKETKSILKLR